MKNLRRGRAEGILFPALRQCVDNAMNDSYITKGSALFDLAPFLAPWYFTNNKPILKLHEEKLAWSFIEKVKEEYVGLITLTDPTNNVLGFVNAYNYVHPSADSKCFLIWNRATKSDTLNPCIKIYLYDTNTLEPLDSSDQAILEFQKSKQQFLFSTKPKATLIYFIEPAMVQNSFSFPSEFKILDPFLVVADYEGLYNGSRELGNTVILELNPKANFIYCYPQDWFNKSNVDLGYQWITRAVRDKHGTIHGQGIRISDFVLDETGTQLKK